MQNNVPTWRKAWIPLAICGALAFVVFASSRETKAPDGTTIITSESQYVAILQRAEGLAKDAFLKEDNGEQLTDKDKQNLQEAALCFKSLNLFIPTRVTTFFGEARCYQGMGVDEFAEGKYRQAIENGPLDSSPEAKLTVPEAHYRLSLLRFKVADYKSAVEEADAALRVEPNAPAYLQARASANVQLGNFREADRDLHKAIQLNPDYAPSVALHKLVSAELHQTKATH